MLKIIVFTGLDGTGKTTHSHLAKEYLEDKGYNVKLIHHFEPIKIFKPVIEKFSSELIELERSSSNKEIFENEDRSVHSLTSILNKYRIVLSGLIKNWYRMFLCNKTDFLIYDRYFYDDIIKINWMYKNIDEKGFANLVNSVPRPNILFYFEISSEKAWKREKEGNTNLKQHEMKMEEYRKLLEILKTIDMKTHKTNTEKPIEETKLEIQKRIDNVVL